MCYIYISRHYIYVCVCVCVCVYFVHVHLPVFANSRILGGDSLHLAICAIQHLDLEHSSYCGRMWSRLSCVLQRQIAREIELRTKEQKYQYKRDEDEEGVGEDAAEEVANR